jgi:hypothetical protein
MLTKISIRKKGADVKRGSRIVTIAIRIVAVIVVAQIYSLDASSNISAIILAGYAPENVTGSSPLFWSIM